MGHFPSEDVHISFIRVGDTVIHQGKEMTVCGKDIRHDPFFGHILFGDCYKLGTQPVNRLIIQRAMP